MYSHNDFTRYALNLENLYWEEYINNIEPINNGLYELLNNIKNIIELNQFSVIDAIYTKDPNFFLQNLLK